MSSVDLAGHMKDLERQKNLEHMLSPLIILFFGMKTGESATFVKAVDGIAGIKKVLQAVSIVRQKTGRSFVVHNPSGSKEVKITRVL